MPSDEPLRVLTLNASLKHEPTISNTGELREARRSGGTRLNN
jgi:hypothetical protein